MTEKSMDAVMIKQDMAIVKQTLWQMSARS